MISYKYFFLCSYTELEIAVPDIGIVGLHAENLGIESVFVDGEATEYEYYPHQQQNVDGEKRWSSVTSPSSAADAAGAVYLSALERERVPNLLINCCKAFRVPNEVQEIVNLENGVPFSGEPKQVPVVNLFKSNASCLNILIFFYFFRKFRLVFTLIISRCCCM